MRKLAYCVALFFCSFSTALPQATVLPGPHAEHNPSLANGKSTLLVLLDDVGSEYLSFMDPAIAPARTPVLESLVSEGLLFDNFWSAATCSAARGMLLTGRYGLRTGVGDLVRPNSNFELPAAEVTLAEKMLARGYATGMFGKWHLGYDPEAPCEQGFQVWSGSLGNLPYSLTPFPGGFYDWVRYDDTNQTTAILSQETTYATTSTTDEAMAWIQAQSGAWFSYVAYNDAHKPWDLPPGYTGPTDKVSVYIAKIEYLDSELGRLLSVVDLDETTVFIISDNGSPKGVEQLPNMLGKSKFTVYRGGVEMPCIVAGHHVRKAVARGLNSPGQVLSGSTHIVDVYRTVLGISPNIGGPGNAGQLKPLDSISLYKAGQGFRDTARAWTFVERFEANGAPPNGPYTLLRRAVEENGYKSIEPDMNSPRELYDTALDPWELFDLLADGISPAEQAVLDSLDARLQTLGLE